MFGAIWANLRRFLTVLLFLGLIALNIATLVSSAVHDFLYKGLSSIPIAAMTDLLANSPTSKKNQLINKNKKINEQLTAQKNKNIAIKKKARNIATSVKKRTAKTAGANITSAFGESVPFYGIAIIASATAYELWSACENMKEMDDLLKEVNFDDSNGETSKICGTKTPSKEDLSASVNFTKEQYAKLKDHLGGFLYDSKEKSKENWEGIQDALGGIIYGLLN